MNEYILNMSNMLDENFKVMNDDTHMMIVIYHGKLHFVRRINNYDIQLVELNAIHYHDSVHDYYPHIRDVSDAHVVVEYNKDPEALSVLDQAVRNAPVEYEYVEVPSPRHVGKTYYMRQIKQNS